MLLLKLDEDLPLQNKTMSSPKWARERGEGREREVYKGSELEGGFMIKVQR